MPKDNFSAQSATYARFRPVFPDALFRCIIDQVRCRQLAWDVATGNGQAATRLSPYFTNVVATDISDQQLAAARPISNVQYRREPAEQSSLQAGSVDLITVAQALHWFDVDAFYKEVRRVGKPGAVIAVFAYSMFRVDNAALDELASKFYAATQPYWDAERKHIDDGYAAILFPFQAIPVPSFSIEQEWGCEDVMGYIRSWSANQHFKKRFGKDLTDDGFERDWKAIAGETPVNISFPVHLRIGRL